MWQDEVKLLLRAEKELEAFPSAIQRRSLDAAKRNLGMSRMNTVMSRNLSDKDLAYNRIAKHWEEVISDYDTLRRIEVLVDEFLGEKSILGRSCLEGGCGLGYFSLAMKRYSPSRVVAVDIAPNLVERLSQLAAGIECRTGDLMDLGRAVSETFDVVLSSEVIEHTPDPRRATVQLLEAVSPGGLICLSCPNRRWIWLLKLAQRLGFRKHYQGHENWVAPSDLVRWIESEGFQVLRKEGIHIIPWHFIPKLLLRTLDRVLRHWSYGISVNLAVLARRSSS